MTKYDEVFDKTMKDYKTPKMNSKDIIEKFELTEKEIEVMKYLYGQQMEKEDILEHFYCKWDRCDGVNYVRKPEISKILGSLKKKGLIYSVTDLLGWLGTDIKI
jgi:DNA-binding MarR family transcriptional regulator